MVSAAQGVTILSEANFDGINTLNGGNAAATMVVSDGSTAALTAPAGSSGQVGIIDSGGANYWGAVNHAGGPIVDLPAGVIAGTDTFTATFRLYIPSTTTFTGTDRVNLIVRRNDNNGGGNFFTNIVWDSIAADTWTSVTVTDTIPAFENDGTTPVTGFNPILSFYDRTDVLGNGNPDAGNAEAGPGTAAFIDDWSFSVTESGVPEPSSSLASLLGFALLGLRRKR